MTLPGTAPQPDFANAALRVAWVGTPHGLLDVLLHVEAQLGRVRSERWGPRTLDLDLLWWSGSPVASGRLRVPHPGLSERAFALAPLLDVAPELSGQYAPALHAAGGAPPAFEWFHAPADWADWQALQFADAAETLACLASACARRWWARSPGPLVALAWDPTPDGARLEAPLDGLRRAADWGFCPQFAVVLDATAARWKGCLLGVGGAPTRPAARPSSRPGLSLRLGQAQVGLSLLT